MIHDDLPPEYHERELEEWRDRMAEEAEEPEDTGE